MTHVAERCVCTSGSSSGTRRDMIFVRQPWPGLKPPCRSRFCLASATRRFARSTNSGVRQWVSDLLTSGLSAATTRKAVFALRQCLAAAIADNRLQFNPATAIPLPTERQKPARYLWRLEVERLVDEMPRQYRALVLVGAYAGQCRQGRPKEGRDLSACDRGRATLTLVFTGDSLRTTQNFHCSSASRWQGACSPYTDTRKSESRMIPFLTPESRHSASSTPPQPQPTTTCPAWPEQQRTFHPRSATVCAVHKRLASGKAWSSTSCSCTSEMWSPSLLEAVGDARAAPACRTPECSGPVNHPNSRSIC
jgi:hypothetical protein